MTGLEQDDPLSDFEHRPVTIDGGTKVVHISGSGPAVVVLAELPGISPHVARFARRVRGAGMTVWMPSLFGADGAVAGADVGKAVFQRICESEEFRVFGAGATSPITTWL